MWFFTFSTGLLYIPYSLVYGSYGVLIWRLIVMANLVNLTTSGINWNPTSWAHLWGIFLGWIIWGGRSTLDPSLLRSENPPQIWVTLSGGLLMDQDTEEGSFCSFLARYQPCWQAHLPCCWDIPLCIVEPTALGLWHRSKTSWDN